MKQLAGQMSMSLGDGLELLSKTQLASLEKYKKFFKYETYRVDGKNHSICCIHAMLKNKLDCVFIPLHTGEVCCYPNNNPFKIEYKHYKSLGSAMASRIKVLQSKGVL